ncbi:uncharacterized protein [Pagrus major]|uniref:uncharacterized protein n=1 Tax=Pagrus major TaxID=143350 RepID=UPI003CC87B77
MATVLDYFFRGPKRLADAVKAKGSKLGAQKGFLPVYKVKLKDEKIQVDGCRRFSFGKDSTKHNRTIMVLGATGAGKSTLINGMINYILGVEWQDPYRFKLVHEDPSKSQAHSQTSEVTVYKLNHQEGFKIDYSLTIVDTPGFGDTRGIERDREITEQLRNLFTDQRGVSEIDAICFVAQSALARLTPTQKYVFDSVLSIFGKDVAENIRVLVTFADGQRPPVLEAIKASGVPCPTTEDGLPLHFKFNNSALFADNKSSEAGGTKEEDEDGGFDQMFWNMGTRSMKRFFVALNVIETKSLTLTKEVLRERQSLENSVENLQKQVKLGLAKLEEVKETAEKLKEHEAEISRNENFEFYVTVKKPVQTDISGTGEYITNCQQCHYTCHHPCAYSNDADKRKCCAMGPDGNCTACPGKCIWSVHYNQKYKWDYVETKKKQTIKSLQEKYLKASKAKTPIEAMIATLRAEYDRVQDKVEKLMESSGKCLNRLKEIALKPNPLSTPEYIDLLIEGEKSEGKPGWKQRVQSLIAIREKAETMAKVDRGENPLHSSPDSNNQTKNNTNQNKTKTNRDQDKINSNADQGEVVTDTNQGQDETKNDSNLNKSRDTEVNANSDQDMLDSDDKTSQDSELDTNSDQDKLDSDANTSQDSELDTNSDQDKLDSDANTSQDSELDTNPDQDKLDSDANTSQDSELDTNSDQDKLDPDAKTSQDSEVNANPDQDKLDPDAKTSQDSEVNANPDQDKLDPDAKTSQDSELDTNSDQDKLDTDAKTSQDSELDTNPDQDKLDSDANTSQDSELLDPNHHWTENSQHR